jgi:hypothetical protein
MDLLDGIDFGNACVKQGTKLIMKKRLGFESRQADSDRSIMVGNSNVGEIGQEDFPSDIGLASKNR